MTFYAVLVMFAIALAALSFIRVQSDPELAATTRAAYAAAEAGETSQLNRLLLTVSKPISGLKQVHLKPESDAYRALRLKLLAAGSPYGAAPEVFLSVQVAACLISAMTIIIALLTGVTGATLGAAGLFSLAFAGVPYNGVREAARKRTDEVSSGLPDFAELMLMPVKSGMGILPALDFTATRLEGPVASEVKILLQVLASRSRTEQEAFTDAGERLGTPAATTFFTSLYQAYNDGTPIADSLRSQASSLRKLSYEATRAKMKALPIKLVFIMALHLLPFLFAVVLLPTIVALGAL